MGLFEGKVFWVERVIGINEEKYVWYRYEFRII